MFRYRNFKNIGYNNPDAPAMYSYETSEDTMAQVLEAGYFSDPRAEIRQGDLVIVKAVDASKICIASSSSTIYAQVASSIIEYGASTGSSVNNSQLIQSMLDSGVKLITVPKGNYLLSSTVILPYGCSIIGESVRNSSDDGANFLVNGDCPAFRHASGASKVTLKNFTITGNNTGSNQHGIDMDGYGSGSVYESLWIRNMGGDGIAAIGDEALGIDLVNMKNLKLQGCSGWGLNLDLDPASNGFNNAMFEQVECTDNVKGGGYIDNAHGNTWIKCHAFENANPDLSVTNGFVVGANTSSQKFDANWCEGNGETTHIDPTHKSAGLKILGGTNHKITDYKSTNSARGIHLVAGTNIIIDNPTIDPKTWMSACEILIEDGVTGTLENYNLNADSKIANFSSGFVIKSDRQLLTSGRLPFNTHMRRGVRGKSHCYTTGSATLFQYTASVNGTAGDDFVTWITSGLIIGDYISIPGAGAGGAALSAYIIDVDVPNKRYYLSTNVLTTVTAAVPGTRLAEVYSEVWANNVTSAISGYFQIGDTVMYPFPNLNSGRTGWRCTAAGTVGTWQLMQNLQP